MLDTAIRNATIITSGDRYRAEIGILNGRIAVIAEKVGPAKEEIDAEGLWVMPGGIDAHVHLDQPGGPNLVPADGFESGTRSAAAGGTTTVMAFAAQAKGQSLRETVEAYHQTAKDKCYVDTSFHLIISDPTPQVMGQELPALVKDGYTSFKVFMTYDDLVLNDAELLEVFDVARREKALVMVHAEGYDAIRYMTRKLEEAGKTAPYYHAVSRPEIVEREATHRAISHAELTDVPIVIVHVSGREPMEQIQWARKRGRKVYAETCPQYIALTADDMKGFDMDFEGAKYVCSPPPRDTSSQEAIWEGLRDGTFDIFSSDHCPFRFDDVKGKKTPGSEKGFKYVPNGIPGIETRLPILFSEGINKGRITPERFVALTATNPARMFGIYPRKGTIAIGSDADLTLWDPTREMPITQSILHHDCDYTPYEGMAVKGWPVRTILRGKTIMAEGEVTGSPTDGVYLERTTSNAYE